MSKHTSGPWTAHSTKSFYVFGPASLSDKAGLDYGPFVCSASTQANARLIAAAPELLEALSDAVSTQPADSPIKWVIRARAALAKAAGENNDL